MPTRRKFIASCTALAATASMKPVIALGSPFRSRQVPLEEISFLDFATKVNSRFMVLSESRALAELRLAAANPLRAERFAVANSEDGRNEKFSLLFMGGEITPLLSGIYDFEHESIGRFQMFISPVGQNETGSCRYEAVFNRPIAGDYRIGLTDNRKLGR
jgi:hypothetical protein